MDQQQQQTPQWSPPPQQPAGWGGAGAMAPAERPLGVTLSAIWFYFIGVLAIIGAAALVALGGFMESVFGSAGSGGFFAGLGIFLAVIVGIVAVLLLLTGYGIWKGRSWGRIGGIIWGVLGVLGGLSTLSGQSGLVTGIVEIVIWGGVIYALWMAKAWFGARA